MNSWIVEPTVEKCQVSCIAKGLCPLNISQCICNQPFGSSDEESCESEHRRDLVKMSIPFSHLQS